MNLLSKIKGRSTSSIEYCHKIKKSVKVQKMKIYILYDYHKGGRKMNFKQKFKRNKGITLIALVVTIIVLLILTD